MLLVRDFGRVAGREREGRGGGVGGTGRVAVSGSKGWG